MIEKNTTFFALVLLALLALTSCENDDTQYYIRYEGQYADWNAGPDKTITYTVATPEGKKSFQSGNAFEYTCGPVEKGFKAEIQITGGDWNRCTTQIFIAREKTMVFVKNTQGGAYASYQIASW